jgi:hypothetical protein
MHNEREVGEEEGELCLDKGCFPAAVATDDADATVQIHAEINLKRGGDGGAKMHNKKK